MQKNIIQAATIITIIWTTVIACSTKAISENDNSQNAPAITELPVDVMIAKEQQVQQIETVSGSVIPNRSVEVMSEISKKVQNVLFSDGSSVRQGQVLYKLDDGEIRAKLRQLQADLDLAHINEKRLSELLKTETVRQEEYDQAQAKLSSLEAAKDILLDNLSKTFIRAPFNGIAGISKVFSGALVSPGLPLVTIQEHDILKLEFNVPEKYHQLVKPGSTIWFRSELHPEEQSANVVSTEVSVNPTTRNITVHAAITNKDRRFKPGMSVKIFFNTSAENEKGIRVPTDALIPGENGYQVFLVKDGIAKANPITVSNRNENDALITSGIANGDTVITSNLLRASDGAPVKIITNH